MKKIRWDIIGIFGGVTGVILGIIAVIRTGAQNRFLIAGAMVLVFGGMGSLLYKLLWQPRFRMRRLLSIGIQGKATILESRETNITINTHPQLKLLVKVFNTNGNDYTTTCKVVVTKAKPVNYFQPGKDISIKIDPENEKNILVLL